MFCAFCHQEIASLNAWKGSSGKLYCSEFCAEEFGVERNPNAAFSPQPRPASRRVLENPRPKPSPPSAS